ncbi:hypothetical protein S40285_03286 [Stachybotrys chlorohalonatus IBT 40285]|uniref:DNA polymerase lambda n=1 Tax=Stachybotrys chlorohalonatus (strain IBT 40285) TaxID=1283841 RepID=A0A084QGS1_STAC4|nr:hypothetical protein S40285_03286 [Stachybotrys chlorohalonata IBT 40285]
MDVPQPVLDDKVARFNLLEYLENDEDDEFDSQEQRNRQRCRMFFQPPPAPTKTPTRRAERAEDNGVLAQGTSRSAASRARRVSSVPIVQPKVIKGTPVGATAAMGHLHDLLDDGASVIKETPLTEVSRPGSKGIRRGDSTPLNPAARSLMRNASDHSPLTNVGTRKRKREAAPKMKPPQQQIFQGLSFHYIPNNDIAPARRIRIAKAREYGATWTLNIAVATHVIVDKAITYKDIERLLPHDAAHALTVVNEDYPIDCIQFRTILDPEQRKYLLRGQPHVIHDDPITVPASSSEESIASLQLKPPHKNQSRWDYLPPNSIESTPRSSEAQVNVEIDSQPAVQGLDEILDSQEKSNNANGGISHDKHQHKPEQPRIVLGTPEDRPHMPADELSECINTMLEFKDLPLDVDDLDEVYASTACLDDSDEDPQPSQKRPELKKPRKRESATGRKDMAFEDLFACNQAGETKAKPANPNIRTIEILQSMADYYDRVNDHWRTTAYRKAISTLKRQDVKIGTEEEAYRLPSVGRRLAQKIEEIVTTDKLQRLEHAKAEPMDAPLQLFLGIYGVGLAQAQQWIGQGFRTLDDLKQGARLTENQRVGVDHYDDLNARIPRREVAALGAVVKDAARKVDPRMELIIGGSYRRGAESSGDIDIIVTKPGTRSTSELRGFLDELVRRLEAEGFLVARLASSRPGGDGSKWHGCCVLPRGLGVKDDTAYCPVWRRIDILLVPGTQKGAALIYFTGNDIFNRSMRLLASKKGMRLNQRGLYKDALRGPGRAKVTEGELVEGRDERRIFEILGVKWREPQERWC